jgi:hypothetical protein
MDLLSQLAETRILEAVERGEFDDLPGAGQPLALDDDRDVPAELRVPYRILKNSGCVPPEVDLRRQIATLEGLLALAQQGDPDHARALARLALLRLRLSVTRRAGAVGFDSAYEGALLDRFR